MICLNLDENSGEDFTFLPIGLALDAMTLAITTQILTDEELLKACQYYETVGHMPEPLKDWWAQYKEKNK